MIRPVISLFFVFRVGGLIYIRREGKRFVFFRKFSIKGESTKPKFILCIGLTRKLRCRRGCPRPPI
eukprot:UN00996